MLSETTKVKRVARCNFLLCLLKHLIAGRLMLLSDEKIFNVNAKMNYKNCSWSITIMFKIIGLVGARTKFRSVFTSYKHRLRWAWRHAITFLKKVVIITTDIYLQILLRTVVKPWMKSVTSGRLHTFRWLPPLRGRCVGLYKLFSAELALR